MQCYVKKLGTSYQILIALLLDYLKRDIFPTADLWIQVLSITQAMFEGAYGVPNL